MTGQAVLLRLEVPRPAGRSSSSAPELLLQLHPCDDSTGGLLLYTPKVLVYTRMVARPRPTRYPHLLQVRVSEELRKEIDELARRTHQLHSDVIRQLIVTGLNRLRVGRAPE